MDRKYNLRLDLQFRCNNSKMVFDEFDNNTSDFFIRVTRAGELIDISKAIVTLVVIKPDNSVDAQFVEINSNRVYCDLKPTMKNLVGKYEAIASITLDGETINTDIKNPIIYEVTENKFLRQLNEKIVTEERFTILTDMINRLSSIETNENTRIGNENFRVEAEKLREQAIEKIKNDATKLITDTKKEINDYKDAKDIAIELNLNQYKEATTQDINNYKNTKNTEIDNYKNAKDLAIDNDLKQYKTNTTEDITQFKNTKNNELDEYKNAKNLEIDNYVINKNLEIDNYKSAKDIEIDNYKKLKDTEINAKLEEVDTAETSRALAEQKRATDHQAREQFLNSFEGQLAQMETEFDKAIANVTNGNENVTNSEIVQARGNEINLNARLNKFDSQLDNKASKIDLDVERKRIDSFTTLPDGSTTGDAELIDGRIGADGNTYNNIGDAIRNQFSDVKRSIYNQDDRFKLWFSEIATQSSKEVSLELEFTNGKFVNVNVANKKVQLNENEDCKYGVIDIENLIVDEVRVSGTGYYLVALLQFADINNRVIQSIPDKSTSDGTVINQTVSIPRGTRYIYYSTRKTYDFSLTLKRNSYEINTSNLVNKQTFDEIIGNLNTKIADITTEVYKNSVSKYISKEGWTATDTNSILSDYYPVKENEQYVITGFSQYYTCGLCLFDRNKNFVSSHLYNGSSAYRFSEKLITIPNGVYYARFCSYLINDYSYSVKKHIKASIGETQNDIYDKINLLNKSNILYRKKWVACGDSFTEGDFTGYVDENGLSGKNSPVIYDDNRGVYKTYPWWIAERNNMILVNEAKCGSDFTNVEGANNPFSVSRYKAVPKDADYITLMFGLNETNLTTEQIGTKTDTTNGTLWGAYNIVFEYFLTNMPYAKIGVIIADAWMNETYANAVKSICAYWGIPVLDLKFDTNIPMGLSGRPNGSSIARQLRDNAFKVTSTNNHPNLEAHKYRSTFIEHWLRSL